MFYRAASSIVAHLANSSVPTQAPATTDHTQIFHLFTENTYSVGKFIFAPVRGYFALASGV
jgi:hypothetical protein